MSTEKNMNWKTPLPGHTWSLAISKQHPSAFGSRRKYNLHTGVDLHCEHMQSVAAVEAGIILSVKNFSRKNNKSPWLNSTRVILIEGETGVVAYCNVKERKNLKRGDLVEADEVIGSVIRLNKKERRNDICMLHLELYLAETTRRVIWSHNYPKPPQLLDPTEHLIKIITEIQVTYKRSFN